MIVVSIGSGGVHVTAIPTQPNPVRFNDACRSHSLSSTRQDIANKSCGLCGEIFGTFGRAIIGTCKHKICSDIYSSKR